MATDWNAFFENPEELKEESPQKKRGRRPGSQNKSKEFLVMQGKLKTLYERVEPLLDDSQRAYYNNLLRGKAQFDALKESELLIRYMNLYVVAALETEMSKEHVTASQDVAKMLDAHRMAIKDYEDMARKREDMKLKAGDDERMVDATRKSPMARFASIHGDDST